MANRSRRSGLWLLAVLLFLVSTLAQENLGTLFEATGLDKLWKHTGVVGAALIWVWQVLANPVATHIYAFAAGILLTIFVGALVEKSQGGTAQASTTPDMPIYDLVDYLTTDTVWAKEKGHISDLMVEHELLDAFGTGRLFAFARKYDHFGSTSQLYKMDNGDFASLKIDLEAIRARRRDTIILKPGYMGDASWHDWRVYRSQAEQLWPKWKLTEVKAAKRTKAHI